MRIRLLFSIALATPLFAAPQPDKLQPLASDARFKFGGVIGERVEANIDNWLLRAPVANPGMLEMFRARDRQPAPSLVPWAGEFAGKYLISCVQALRMSDREDSALPTEVAKFVWWLIETQAEDGYLGPFPKHRRLLGEWDLWGHYHVMQGLLAWYDFSGEQRALVAVRKAADLICRTYLDGTRRVFDAGSPEMNMAVSHVLAELHRRTGEPRYLALVREIEKDWERAGDYLRTGEQGIPFYKTPRPRWESLHDLQAIAELWRITGEARYREAFTSHWRTIREFDVRNSGAFSGGEQATGNAFAPTAIETCCTVAWMALTVDMLRLTGDPLVADELELSTLNAALGAMHPSGRWWTYNTPMDGERKASAHDIVFQARAGTPELNCCSVNGPRSLGLLADWAVMRDAEGLVVNWHQPMEVTTKNASGAKVVLRCASIFPMTGSLTWTASGESGPIRFRIPAWAQNARARIDGTEITVKPGSYLRVKGLPEHSHLEFFFPMALRTLAGQREQAGKVSIYCGPFLLAYDQRDNSFDEFAIPRVDPTQLGNGAGEARYGFGSEGEPTLRPKVDPLSPWLRAQVPTPRGPLILRDYATAGMNGTRYRSWLRTTATTTRQNAGSPPDLRVDLHGDAKPQSGTLVRATNFSSVENAIRLNGQDEMLVYALPENFGGDYTVAVRARINALPDKRIGQIFSAWCAAGDDPLRVVVQDGAIFARIEGGSGASLGGAAAKPGEWQHLAAVKEADVLTLYVNGVPSAVGSAPAKLATKSKACALGGNPLHTGSEFLAADFADFSVYRRALNEDEIASLAK
ncbi:MAG TPA: beta-L-arabinofuranosidase domain-containing protein [Chthoniobacteraceae bacterium]|nr:beta-L-arabinofuranosidase domain-containing protein [Chthoniobacteraceae bacterium]